MTACILVVDDTEANIKLLEAKLVNEYYTVFTANNGIKALDILEQNKIDLVLLDVMMPDMDGFETCKRIKSNPETSHIPVIIVTALSDVDDKIKGLEAGADEFLTKPINDIPLLPRVKSLTRMKMLIDELKIRNRTNEELGESPIDLKDNFRESKILFINDDKIQARNINNILTEVTNNIWIISDPDKIKDLTTDYIPDLIIISCQLEQPYDPLRILITLKAQESYKYAVFMMMAEEENLPMIIKGIDLGINDYFLSSADKNELIARIRTQLRRKNYQDNLRSSLEQSVNLSIKDSLTNVFNRRYIDKHINQMIKNANLNSSNLSVITIDIDNFKDVNDTYGHQEGDKVLKEFTAIIQDSIRVTDLIGRYGGEEFIVLLGDTTIGEAKEIAEEIRKNIETATFQLYGNVSIKKTASFGVAEYIVKEAATSSFVVAEYIVKEAASLFARADSALYKAKNAGRNQVSISVEN
jgi:two-component system, cell cycle response regulator